MFSANEIKNIDFSTVLRGYKIDEVEVFLDKIEADYIQFERVISDYQSKINDLEVEVAELKKSQDSIQNVLLNAQKLADQIVTEAKEKSEEIITNAEQNIVVISKKEEELSIAFEKKAKERKENLKLELKEMAQKAELKSKSIMEAAEDSVKRQQVLFDKLKLEVAAFKSLVTSKYKEHLNILQEIPDTVDLSPKEMADIVMAKIDQLPNPEDFIEVKNEEVKEADNKDNEEVVKSNNNSNGFTIEENIEN